MGEDIVALAEKILQQSKSVLCSDLHALIRGVNMFCYKFTNQGTAFTDGTDFYCNPSVVCRIFYDEPTGVNRLLLHSMLHCMLLHPFNTDFKNEKLWNLACDIAVEHTINEWKLSCTESPTESIQSSYINSLSEKLKNLTAENIYYYLLGEENSSCEKLSQLFIQDEHYIWYEGKKLHLNSDVENVSEIHSIYKFADETAGETTLSKEKTLTETVNSSAEDSQEAWRSIASHIAKEAESAKRLGQTSGIDVQLLKAVTQKRYDYGDFLRRFLAVNEILKINDDEFDNIFYTYGLKLYDNMPIVEPLEYAEDNKIKKLFIAIDTSGSVKGDIVQGFMDKTYSILKQNDYFSRQCEVHIIQCDSAIQDVVIIRTAQELDHYVSNVTLKGFGGTDFTPVFEYVTNVCASSKNDVVNGLIYFTDGDGIYPSQGPVFKSVFAIHDNGFDKGRVPSWATVLYVDKFDLVR